MENSRLIGPRILRNTNFLKNLCKTSSSKKRHRLIETASSDELLSIVEICLNLLKSPFKLKPTQKKKLISHAPFIRKLSQTTSENRARKVIQKGSGLVLRAILSPILAEVVGAIINNLKNKNE